MSKKKSTPCKHCGAPIPYVTSKPSLCPKCKGAKSTTKKKGRAEKTNKTPWQNERLMFQILNYLFPQTQYCQNGYYSWLKSPKGQPMQLDWYSYEMGLAFEYQGEQHHKRNKYFHKTKADFDYQKECDKLKKKLCQEEGVCLIHIDYDIDMNGINIALEIKKQEPSFFKNILKNGEITLTQEDLREIDLRNK